jgi:hypothetical protein
MPVRPSVVLLSIHFRTEVMATSLPRGASAPRHPMRSDSHGSALASHRMAERSNEQVSKVDRLPTIIAARNNRRLIAVAKSATFDELKVADLYTGVGMIGAPPMVASAARACFFSRPD